MQSFSPRYAPPRASLAKNRASLVALGASSSSLFASPLAVSESVRGESWLYRFSLFHAGRRDHPMLLAALSGLRPKDDNSQLVLAELLTRLAHFPNARFPDTIAYFDLAGPFDTDLLMADWQLGQHARQALVERELRNHQFHGILNIATDRETRKPGLAADGVSAELLAGFDPWRRFSPDLPSPTRVHSGPTSIADDFANKPFVVTVYLPLTLSPAEPAALAASLEAIFSNFSAHLRRGHGI